MLARSSRFGNQLLTAPILAFSMLAGCATKPNGPEIIWAGTYRTATSKIISEPNAAGGARIESDGFEFLSTSTRVPAVVGSHFGMRFTLPTESPSRDVLFRKVWHFPPPGLKDPRGAGRGIIRQGSQAACGGPTECFVGWAITEAWEQVPGVWTVEIMVDGKTVLSQSFDLYIPDGT